MATSVNKHNVTLPKDIRRDLKTVSSRLRSLGVSDFVNRDLFIPSVHLLNRNSKLLRPALVLMGAKAAGRNTSDFIDLAMAAELLHTSSLIHDDMIDGDSMRRGVESVHKKYGNAIALLAGDALLSKAISLASGYGEQTLKSMTKASMDMCAGEALDYGYQRSGRVPTLKEYIRVALLKSASLIGACWSAAAVHAKSSIGRSLYASGIDMGMAFQIRDDILDFVEWQGNGGSKRPVPNIVTSIGRDGSADERAALVKAVKLNNYYISRSEGRLRGMKSGGIFSGYAELIRVSL